MIDLNKVLLSARLTRDPEMKYIPSGTAVCTMRVAADRSFGGGDGGERQKETLFVEVTAWGKTAEFCEQYMSKGSAIFVEGRLKLDQWDDRDTGKKREKISIVADRVQFGESRAEADARKGGQPEPTRRSKPAPSQPKASADDLPF